MLFSLTPHNATAGDPGKLPGQYSYLLCVPATVPLLLSDPSPQDLCLRHQQESTGNSSCCTALPNQPGSP